MRVILIMIADRVNVMRQIKDTGNEEDRVKVANEAAYLYAPLAHKLGLYKLKSELEDLSLKYTQRETYYYIKEKDVYKRQLLPSPQFVSLYHATHPDRRSAAHSKARLPYGG